MGDYIQYYPGAPFCGSTIEEYEKFISDLVDVETRKADFSLSEMDLYKEGENLADQIFSCQPDARRTNYKVPGMAPHPIEMATPKFGVGYYYQALDVSLSFTFHSCPNWFAIYRYLEKHEKVTFEWTSYRSDNPLAKFIPLVELSFSDYKKADVDMTIPIVALPISSGMSLEQLMHSVVPFINAVDRKLRPDLKDDPDVMASAKTFSSKNQDIIFLQKLRSLV